ncbi:hypothetical protein OAH18_01530 [bacterium]|nr:hypothetical protein [bacterium]
MLLDESNTEFRDVLLSSVDISDVVTDSLGICDTIHAPKTTVQTGDVILKSKIARGNSTGTDLHIPPGTRVLGFFPPESIDFDEFEVGQTVNVYFSDDSTGQMAAECCSEIYELSGAELISMYRSNTKFRRNTLAVAVSPADAARFVAVLPNSACRRNPARIEASGSDQSSFQISRRHPD